MRLQSERISTLQECGLSESQARVFVTLVDYPAGTASSLAKAAQLPRNRLYETLEELNALGLVDIVLEEPRRYRARPIDSYITRCSNELRARIDRLESRRPYLAAAFHPRDPETADDHERGTTQAITGRRAVAEEIDRMLNDARREIVMAGSVGGSLRLAKHLVEARLAAPGLQIELFAPIASAANGGWEGYLEREIARPIWIQAPRATLVVIIDQEEMLRIHPVPDDERTHVGNDFALLTNNLAIIHDELIGIRSLARATPGERVVPVGVEAKAA